MMALTDGGGPEGRNNADQLRDLCRRVTESEQEAMETMMTFWGKGGPAYGGAGGAGMGASGEFHSSLLRQRGAGRGVGVLDEQRAPGEGHLAGQRFAERDWLQTSHVPGESGAAHELE